VVSANLYVTSPTGSTVWPAGQNATIKWQDDGTTPSVTFTLVDFATYIQCA